MRVAVLDIETTALKHHLGSIVEIGICLIDLESRDSEELFESVVNDNFDPERESHAWIFRNTDLTPDEVINAKKLDHYRVKLQKILNKYPVIAYNQRFDFGWLESRGFKIGKRYSDPMILCGDLIKIPHDYYGLKYPKVQEAMDYFNIRAVEEHRAFSDCLYEALIVAELYDRGLYHDEF